MISMHSMKNLAFIFLLLFSVNAFSGPLVSKEDSARVLSLTKNQWDLEVTRADVQGVAQKVFISGNFGMRTTVQGVVLTVVPHFPTQSSAQSKPNYIAIINNFPVGSSVYRLNDAELRAICEKAYRQIIDDYSFLCSVRKLSEGLELTFIVGVKGRHKPADEANSRDLFYVDVGSIFNHIDSDRKNLIEKYWAELDLLVNLSAPNSKFIEELVKKGPEICGKLSLAYRNNINFKRDEFDFDVDVCMKATVHRRIKQPEFSNPLIVNKICSPSNEFFHNLCRKADVNMN